MVASFLEATDYDDPSKFVCSGDNTITRPFKVSERYPEFEKRYVKPALKWWKDHVESGISPEYDEKKDAEILKVLRTNNLSPETDMAALVKEAEALKSKLDAHAAEVAEDEKRYKVVTDMLKKLAIAQFRDGDKKVSMKDDGSYEYLHGLFTQEGQTVIPDTYTEIRILQGSSYVLCKDGSYGLSRISGTTVTPVIPMQYKEMRTHTPQFIELYDGSNYSLVDLNNNVVVPESTEKINAFKGDEGGLWETLDRVDCYAEEYDGYTKSVLPFISKTGNGYLTTYADYKTGKADGQLPVRASNLNDGGWFAYQNANGLYGIGRLSTGFLDIEPESWKDDSASWAAARKITDGVGGGKFDPDKNCTNAQIITFLYRAETGNIVSGANWDVDAINWAKEQGMIGDGFDKTQPCTRAAALKFIWQAFGSQKPEKESSFTDIPAGADYADAVSWAVGLPTPITNGYGATFAPNDVCSRAHIVTFLYRAYGNS